jgi:hypothetical protein
MGIKNMRDAMIHTAFEPAIQVLLSVLKRVVVAVADVRVGLSSVVTESVKMVIIPVLFFEEAMCVSLNRRGEAVAHFVSVLRDVELFGKLCHSSSWSGSEMRVILRCAPIQRFGTIT